MDLENRKKTLVWFIYGILHSDISNGEKIKLISMEVEDIIDQMRRTGEGFNAKQKKT